MLPASMSKVGPRRRANTARLCLAVSGPGSGRRKNGPFCRAWRDLSQVFANGGQGQGHAHIQRLPRLATNSQFPLLTGWRLLLGLDLSANRIRFWRW